jgi:hypothetical protein
MKNTLIITALLMALTATQASAACLAEYKAKRDNPLKLEYGTMTVSDTACTVATAESIVRETLAQRGWKLLSIISVKNSG